MYREIALFLLKIPPLEEIGGKITHIIEQYRAGVLEEQDCLQRILTEHKQFISEYINKTTTISQLLY